MFYLNDAVDNFIELLNNNEYFENISIVKAFGTDTVETLPGCIYIAVGISEMNFSDRAAGQDVKAGEVQIFADIFIPYTVAPGAAAAQEIISEICSSIMDCNVLSIYVGKPYADSNTRCTVVESAYKFNDLICFGGQNE
ncbi:MAG: hypothetical protein LUH82_05130 [Clostridiales bacterium]|nr:hypothetical protein [Clostridiales bacterium]